MQLNKWVIKNKYKLIAGSAFFASLVTIPPVVGAIQANELRKNNDNRYIYKPGEVRFDENGKLIIPEVIDKDNLNGDYDYKIDYNINTNILNDDNDIQKEVQYYNKKNLENIKNIFRDSLNSTFTVNQNIKLALDNILPNNEITIDQQFSLDKFIENIAQNASDLYKVNSLSLVDTKNYCALSGINLDKEYNEMMTNKNHKINNKGGGGQQIPENTPPPSPNIGYIDPDSMTWIQQQEVLNENMKYLRIFAITNSVVLSVLTIMSVTFSILSVLTGGSSLSSLIWLIPEIIFSSLVIAGSWQEYYATKELRSSIFDDLFNEILFALGISYDVSQIIRKPVSNFINILKNSKNINIIKETIKRIKNFSKLVKNLSFNMWNAALIANSISSMLYSIVMHELYNALIKDIWIEQYVEGVFNKVN